MSVINKEPIAYRVFVEPYYSKKVSTLQEAWDFAKQYVVMPSGPNKVYVESLIKEGKEGRWCYGFCEGCITPLY